MSFEVAVVGHVDRTQHAWHLADLTGAKYIALDDGSRGVDFNHIQAWRWHLGGKSEWSVVLEDDAIPVLGFRRHLDNALPHAPSPLVSLYLGRVRPQFIQQRAEEATQRPECWITADRLYHCVGVAMKTSLIPIMLDSVERLVSIMPIDEAIGSWAYRLKMPVSYSNPSLVDHNWKLGSIGSSHLPEAERVAWRFGSREHWDSSAYSL